MSRRLLDWMDRSGIDWGYWIFAGGLGAVAVIGAWAVMAR